ncbi:DUF6261 family protein [Marinoscillum sp.]|uniref:DUF6261 family protein n=1 Tax=Marinoscillum sp. TaxID=2024838 RepID=UPI003BA9AFBF
MPIINGILLTALRNSEFSQFTSDVLELILRNDPVALLVEDAYNALKAENNQLVDLLNPQKGSALTTQVEAADDRRDHCVTGINLVAAGYTHHFDGTLRMHAQTLQRHLTQFGGASLARQNYQSETAGINALLTDWASKPELAAALTALGLDSWKDELTLANKAFNDLYLSRTEETSAASPATVRSIRTGMMPLYYELRDLVASYHTIKKGAAPYGATVSQLNALIDQYNLLLAARKGKSSHEPDTPAAA